METRTCEEYVLGELRQLQKENDALMDELGRSAPGGSPAALRVCMTPDAGYVPAYAHEGDAGLDLRAVEGYLIPARSSRMVRTGLRCEVPEGFVGLQFPRSGLGSRGITLRNAVGVIDSGFRGEVLCPLWNTTDESFRVERGDRVCQLVIVPCLRLDVVQCERLSDSERGGDGYGSTGVR